jgi:hypothetical protein
MIHLIVPVCVLLRKHTCAGAAARPDELLLLLSSQLADDCVTLPPDPAPTGSSKRRAAG